MANIDIEELERKYFCNIYDVPYVLKKGGEILIKPVLLKDSSLYEWAKQCLEIDKNASNEIEIIQCSYLKFLIEYLFPSAPDFENQLRNLLSLCLGFDYVAFTKDKGKSCIAVCNEDKELKYVINSKEFDDIKKIILHQNNPSYDDRYINPDVKEMLAEYYKVKYNNMNVPTMEKKKGFVSSKTGKTFKELNEISYREFAILYDELLAQDNYYIYKIVASNFQDTTINEVLHPLFAKKHDIYEELFTSTSALQGKGISGAEQLNAMNFET